MSNAPSVAKIASSAFYYNEFDPRAAQWIRNLIAAGHLPAGEVDERSIVDVSPADLAGFRQCHFFAGIGGWPLALRLAGWPDDLEIWTGSCPCQPFSAAGKGDGFADERHLWPSFHWLIQQRRPAIVAGEQVASADVGPWIDLVLTDLEALGYACGAYAGPAAGVGAPHLRDRSYWLGYADHARLEGLAGNGGAARREGSRGSVAEAGVSLRLAHAESIGRGRRQGLSAGRDDDREIAERGEGFDGLAGIDEAGISRSGRPGPLHGLWRDADWLLCRDGKWRPVEPGSFPLAHGIPGRVGRLRGYGNAIVPQQAAEFIRAVMDCMP